MSSAPVKVGSASITGTATTFSVTLTANIPSGTEIIICYGAVNPSFGGTPIVTDSKANTYVDEGKEAIGFAADIGMVSSKTTTDLVVGDSITLTVPSSGTYDAVVIIVYTVDKVKLPYTPDPGQSSVRPAGDFIFAASPLFPDTPTTVVNVAANAALQPHIIIGIVGWTGGLTLTETYLPDYTHLDTETCGTGTGIVTISITYSIVPHYITTQPTYTIDTATGTSTTPFGGYGLFTTFFVIGARLKKLDCKYDRLKGRRYTVAIDVLGHSVIFGDDDIATVLTSALTPVIIDTASGCDYPNIHVFKDSKLLHTYEIAGTLLSRTCDDLGKTWSNAVSIATGYTAHDLNADFAGFFVIVPAFNPIDQHLYIITGNADGSGNINWNSPVDTGITSLETSPALVIMPDGSFELTYADTSGGITIARCKKLSPAGIGTWS